MWHDAQSAWLAYISFSGSSGEKNGAAMAKKKKKEKRGSVAAKHQRMLAAIAAAMAAAAYKRIAWRAWRVCSYHKYQHGESIK